MYIYIYIHIYIYTQLYIYIHCIYTYITDEVKARRTPSDVVYAPSSY